MSPKNLYDSLGQLAGPKSPGLQVPNLVGSVLIDLLWVKLDLTELKVKTYLEVDLAWSLRLAGVAESGWEIGFPSPATSCCLESWGLESSWVPVESELGLKPW